MNVYVVRWDIPIGDNKSQICVLNLYTGLFISPSGNFITGLTSAASPRVHISSTCKVGQKLGVSLPLLTCSPLAWPSRLLYRRGQKSRRDLWITLHFGSNCEQSSGRLHTNVDARKIIYQYIIIYILVYNYILIYWHIFFSCINVYERPDDSSQLQLKHVAVNELIQLLCVCVAE
jgi:hypothetical protein